MQFCFDFGRRYVDILQLRLNFACCVQHCVISIENVVSCQKYITSFGTDRYVIANVPTLLSETTQR